MRLQLGFATALASLALLALAPSGGATELEAVLEAPESEFASGEDVRLWLALRNPRARDCRPVFVDPMLESQPSPPDSVFARRPHTVVTLEIRDSHGKQVGGCRGFGQRARNLRVHELVLLYCGHGYQWEIWPGRGPFDCRLSPGRYRARMRVKVPVASFLKNRDGVESELETLWRQNIGVTRAYVRDEEAVSNEVEFTIRP